MGRGRTDHVATVRCGLGSITVERRSILLPARSTDAFSDFLESGRDCVGSDSQGGSVNRIRIAKRIHVAGNVFARRHNQSDLSIACA